MQCELPRVFIGRRDGGSRRLSGGARIARKPWPYPTPTDTTEGSQRGSQGHEQGFWRRIGGQQSYQAHAKACPLDSAVALDPLSRFHGTYLFHPQELAYPEAHSAPILASTRGDSPGSSRSSRSSALTTRIPSVSLS